jgi:DNA modification methylase
MSNDFDKVQVGRERQKLRDDVVHDWYRFVLAYPDHLVVKMLERFGADRGDTVLDPFCGTGTTLTECKKLGIDAVGIEANPVCEFASRVKTNWSIDPERLRSAARDIIERATPQADALTFGAQPLFAQAYDSNGLKERLLASSPEARYFVSSGMLKGGWLSEVPFYKTIALLNEIKGFTGDTAVQDVLRLALAAILVETVANVSFGPEIYVSGKIDDVDVLNVFWTKVDKIATDLEVVKDTCLDGQTRLFLGDARECARILGENGITGVDFVITSPPYPTEKDYTRQTRLELVFLGHVYDRKSLRRIKNAMIRSHSKGIYKADSDGRYVKEIPEVQAIADELREKVASKTYGFAKLYPRIIEEYFGGMHRHLVSLLSVLRERGRCAYVVGDQRTYLQTYTPTGKILAIVAERIGFEVEDRLVWRVRKGTTGSGEEIKEEILILRKPVAK